MRKNIEFVIFLKLLLKSERQCAILVSMLWSNDFLRRIFGYGSLESSAKMGGRRRCNAMKKQGFLLQISQAKGQSVALSFLRKAAL